MHAHSVDYLERDGRKPGTLVNRGWWVHGLPRLMPLCRALGHRPVVDGTGTPGDAHRYLVRWVVCDRCGVRPEPQGALDPTRWDIGQRYTGSWADAVPEHQVLTGARRFEAMKAAKTGYHPPGPWPARPTGEIGGQVVIGKSIGGAGIGIKVGNAGSEHVLAAHIYLGPLGYLALHTENFGQGLQRRLNPVGYQSRVIEVSISHGRLTWKMWAKRDEWTRGTPRRQDGSIRIDPRDILLGERRYSYEDVEGSLTATVRMPEGDDHPVQLTLKRCRLARCRGRAVLSWDVQWESKNGIPVRNHDWKGDCVYSSSVKVNDAAVEQGRWVPEACAAIAAHLSADRSRYGWRPRAAETKAP